MKKLLLVYTLLLSGALLTVFLFHTLAQAGGPDIHRNEGNENAGINFLENQWDTAMQKAAAEHKYIFLDAYATWCGPCKLLKRTSFKDKDVAAFFNEHFINVSMDVEKGKGPELASKWRILGIPTLIVFDATGQPVLQSTGYLKAEDLLAFGKQALQKNSK